MSNSKAALIKHLEGWIPLESRQNNPTYVRLIAAVLDNDELLELASCVPEPQLPANVLFASVHFLLLQGTVHPLALHYPTVRLRHGLNLNPTATLEDDFLDFTRANRDELLALLATGITQTNEVARSAILSAVLGDLASEGVIEVSVVDAGCSAGLNLLVDQYRITCSPDVATGPEASSVNLFPHHRGRVPSGQLPSLVHRVGLDQQPLDPSNHRDATWLAACLWPDDPTRFTRLQAALNLALRHRNLFQLHAGDLIGDLSRVAMTVPKGTHLVIFTSWAAAYLKSGEHAALTRQVDEIGATREVTWLSFEHPLTATALGLVEPGFCTKWPGASVLTRRTCGTTARTVVVGEAHPHAEWINLT